MAAWWIFCLFRRLIKNGCPCQGLSVLFGTASFLVLLAVVVYRCHLILLCIVAKVPAEVVAIVDTMHHFAE